MSRNKSFNESKDQVSKKGKDKNLRHNTREAFFYFNPENKNLRHNTREALFYSNPEKPSIPSYRTPGRGVSGESSN
jgi:hypothetical protein